MIVIPIVLSGRIKYSFIALEKHELSGSSKNTHWVIAKQHIGITANDWTIATKLPTPYKILMPIMLYNDGVITAIENESHIIKAKSIYRRAFFLMPWPKPLIVAEVPSKRKFLFTNDIPDNPTA